MTDEDVIKRMGLTADEIAALGDDDQSAAVPAIDPSLDEEANDGEAAIAAVYKAPPVEDYEERVSTLEARLAELEQQWKKGEIDFDDFRNSERAIADERRALYDARLKHEISAEQNEQQVAARWRSDVQKFMRDTATKDGLDYRATQNRALWAALDAEVRALANDEANEGRSGRWILERAHRTIQAIRGGESGMEEGASRSTGGASLARLDSLQGLELEAALASMSSDEAERYLSGGSR